MSVDVEEIFPLLLAGAPAVVAIADDRFYPNRLPAPESMPCVIFRRISGGPIPISDGESTTRKAVFQVECWSATSQEQARDLDRKAQAIKTITRRVGDWWVQCLKVNADTDNDNPQIPINADDLGAFCSFFEATVFYQPEA